MARSLSELITDENVVIGSSADGWEDAIRRAAVPLLEASAITGEYVDKMIGIVHQFGPYIVIGPHVALAHARPDGTVSRTSMSALTAPDGIAFGHESHDPVRLVLCLAAVDDTEHLEALRSFVQIIRTPEALDRLVAATTPQEFREAIRLNEA